ncbi:hypothetical protein [Flavobacterium sp.]|uniref:hypothetical protein n=1 Tax=Flavobacterium sp. TaxID=239 RepID=UPI00375156F5
MTDIKKDFTINSKNYFEADFITKRIFDKMFELLSEDVKEIEKYKNGYFHIINDKETSRFNVKLPDDMFLKVIEAFTVAKSQF